VIAARRIDALEKVAAELKTISPASKVLAVKVDITSEEEVKKLFSSVQETFGRPADILINNAGYLKDDQTIGETSPNEWWTGIVSATSPAYGSVANEKKEINLKGAYTMTHYFIQSQPNPKEPVGTIITVSSGRAGLTGVGGSAYNISKVAEQRLNEHLQLGKYPSYPDSQISLTSYMIEYPTLRVFTTMPGISPTEMATEFWLQFAHDHVDLTGMLALYLAQPRADFLKGSMVGVNWDVEELEQHKEEIVKGKVFQTSWLPILPFNGGKGLGA
jgi:NAD(P)-dependent dehydrogenase (short-subunit alcohol dehydrogenase family)